MKRNSPQDESANDVNNGYEVGYGKPPKSGQFKPGQSGNPNGRPKGNKNASTLLLEALAEKVTIRENGTVRTITKAEAAVKQMVNGAAKGDSKAMNKLMPLMLALEEQERQKEGKESRSLLSSSQRQDVADSLRSRLRNLVQESGDE